MRVAAKLDGVGERDAASNDARPGLFKTGPRGTVRLSPGTIVTHGSRRVHTNGENYTPPHIYAKSHMHVPPAYND